MRLKFTRLFFVFALLAASIAAQEKQQQRTGPDAPSVERLRQHITHLASDKLEGRRTGTPGAEMAARYIADEFKRLGLTPINSSPIGTGKRQNDVNPSFDYANYQQQFPYVVNVELDQKNDAKLLVSDADAGRKQSRLRLGEDWLPLGWSANANVEHVSIAFAGYGITASDLNYDDYAELDVKDKVALAFAGTPDGDNPHGKFVRYTELRFKATAARNHGAKALILIANEESFKEDRLSRLRYDNSGGEAGLPVIVISRQAAAKILGVDGVQHLAEIEKKLSEKASSNAQGTNDEAFKFAPSQDTSLSLTVNLKRLTAPAHNVIGILEGSDPKLKSEAIIIGAHYDHLGRGGQGSLAGREGEIHYGADDNASGTAGLLELARLFAEERGKLRRTIIFIAFGGEEEGLLGSNFYVNNPVGMPLTQIVAMINMDMIGRMREDRLMIGGVGTAKEWREWIERANTNVNREVKPGLDAAKRESSYGGVPVPLGTSEQATLAAPAAPKQRFTLSLNEDGFGPSDHSSFYAKKIPVLFFFTGTHEDYHKPSDTAEKINYEGEANILSFIRDIVLELQRSDSRPTYAVAKSASQGRSIGFRVYLGTVPSYAESTNGMKLDAVRDDSPAAKAGLKAGDTITRIAGRDIRNVYDYTYMLSEMKAGQEYEVEVLREGKTIRLKIIPVGRK